MFYKRFILFYYVLRCLVSRATIGIIASATADCLRDRNNGTGIGDNSAEIGDDAAGIVDIAEKVIPCWTPSLMETGVTLFLENNFRRGPRLCELFLEMVNSRQVLNALINCSFHICESHVLRMPNSYGMSYRFVPFIVGLEQQGLSINSAHKIGARLPVGGRHKVKQ